MSRKTSLLIAVVALFATGHASAEAAAVKPVTKKVIASTTTGTATTVTLDGSDPAGRPGLTYALVSSPHRGTATLVGTGPDVTYTPPAGWRGVTWFKYKATVAGVDSDPTFVVVGVSNRAPLPTSTALTHTVAEDSTGVTITIGGTDPDGDRFWLSLDEAEFPRGGKLIPTGHLRKAKFVPEKDWNGSDYFTCRLHDGHSYSSWVKVTLNVTASPDTPVAKNLSVITKQDSALTVRLSATDPDDRTGMTYTVTSPPSHGSFALTGSGPKGTYTPKAGWHGTEAFKYKATVGGTDSNIATVAVTVAPVVAGQGWVRFGTPSSGYTVVRASIDTAGNITCPDDPTHYHKYVKYFTVPKSRQSHADFSSTDVAKIKALEVNNDFHKLVFARMFNCYGEWFSFKDGAEATNEVEMRLQAVAKMNDLNTDQRKYWYGIPFKTTCPKWTNAKPGHFFYKEKEPTTSSHDAIVELCDTGTSATQNTVGECLGGLIACLWWGSAKSMGKTAFDAAVPFGKLNMSWFEGESPPHKLYSFAWARFALSKGVHVPGDWVYMQNHDYGALISNRGYMTKKDFATGAKLLPKLSYPYSGENALYCGKVGGVDMYEGLGPERKSEADLREYLRTEYNHRDRGMGPLIDAKMRDGVTKRFPSIVDIRPGVDADTKIGWTGETRVHNPRQPNAPPVVRDSTAVVVEDRGAQPIWATAEDVYLLDISATVTAPPAHGTLSSCKWGYRRGVAYLLWTYTPNADFHGTDTFKYKVKDGALESAEATVTITVSPVNDRPSFTKGAGQVVKEDAGAQTVAGWATGISAGPANEATQTLSFQVTNDSNGLFTAQPAVSSTGSLTYTPKAGAKGVASVSIKLKDSGGTANGGVDTSVSQTFKITVE